MSALSYLSPTLKRQWRARDCKNFLRENSPESSLTFLSTFRVEFQERQGVGDGMETAFYLQKLKREGLSQVFPYWKANRIFPDTQLLNCRSG